MGKLTGPPMPADDLPVRLTTAPPAQFTLQSPATGFDGAVIPKVNRRDVPEQNSRLEVFQDSRVRDAAPSPRRAPRGCGPRSEDETAPRLERPPVDIAQSAAWNPRTAVDQEFPAGDRCQEMCQCTRDTVPIGRVVRPHSRPASEIMIARLQSGIAAAAGCVLRLEDAVDARPNLNRSWSPKSGDAQHQEDVWLCLSCGATTSVLPRSGSTPLTVSEVAKAASNDGLVDVVVAALHTMPAVRPVGRRAQRSHKAPIRLGGRQELVWRLVVQTTAYGMP
ncbi:hypothetical protein C8Q78DRAFT_317326 [Trametes maxima]|nr:hypothetical protein C8Q78DRAFT_317326 [Trametes maxima]